MNIKYAFLIALLIFPTTSQAQSISELEAQIAALQAQIASLQQIINSSGNTETIVNTTQTTDIAISGQIQRKLRVGDSGEDVRLLQRVLNIDEATTLAVAGAGSPGNETTYFGAKTKAGVIKFQELYASEILKPLNLSRGTGFVGVKTLEIVNDLISEVGSNPTPQNQNNTNNTGLSQIIGKLAPNGSDFVIELLPTSLRDAVSTAHPGKLARAVESQSGFEEFQESASNVNASSKFLNRPNTFDLTGNIVNFGGINIYNLPSDGKTLFFVVPEVPAGIYTVSVTNSRGTSNAEPHTVEKTPTSWAKSPKITNITPKLGENGTALTIKGENFSQFGNVIQTSFNTISGISSGDGETIVFSLDTPLGNISDIAAEYTLPFTVMIAVESGGVLSNWYPFIIN